LPAEGIGMQDESIHDSEAPAIETSPGSSPR